MFALTNHKGPLFYPLFAAFIYYGSGRKNVIPIIISGLIMLLTISLLFYLINPGHKLLASLFLRRVFLVPGLLNYFYFEYFSTHPFVLWSSSKLSFDFVDYPYDLDVPHLIGLEYFSNDLTGANTGWIGSGYMQLGYSGMMIYSCMLGLIYCLINSYTTSIDKRIVVSIVAVPMFVVMQSSDLPTAFLSHGILLSIVMLMLLYSKTGNTEVII